jgi:hypothetical protein
MLSFKSQVYKFSFLGCYVSPLMPIVVLLIINTSTVMIATSASNKQSLHDQSIDTKEVDAINCEHYC